MRFATGEMALSASTSKSRRKNRTVRLPKIHTNTHKLTGNIGSKNDQYHVYILLSIITVTGLIAVYL